MLPRDTPPALNHGVSRAPEAPENVRSWGHRRNLSSMNALEVAPRAKADHVFLGVVAAVGTESEMMRRDVAPAATGTLAAMAIALVDVRILDFGTARTPRVDEELAGEAQKGRGAPGGPAVAQIN